MIKSVGGPSPADILRCVSDNAPWYITLARASAEDRLAAHFKVKRRLDFTSSAKELSDSLALQDPMAAIVLSTVSAAHNNPLCAKAVDAFVNAKCPAIKYKQLLLPEHGGSFDRAKRHFSDLKASSDPVVAALAAERDFVCSYIEHQYTAPPKKAAKNMIPEIPYHALVQLRFMFKSLSIRLKKATARNEAELVLARSWYSDHMIIAQSFVQQHFVEQAALVMRGAPPAAMPQPQANKRQKTQHLSLPAPQLLQLSRALKLQVSHPRFQSRCATSSRPTCLLQLLNKPLPGTKSRMSRPSRSCSVVSARTALRRGRVSLNTSSTFVVKTETSAFSNAPAARREDTGSEIAPRYVTSSSNERVCVQMCI